MVETKKVKKCAVRISRLNITIMDVEEIQAAMTDQRVRRCLVRLHRLKNEGSDVLLYNGEQMRNCCIRLKRIVGCEDKPSESSHDGMGDY